MPWPCGVPPRCGGAVPWPCGVPPRCGGAVPWYGGAVARHRGATACRVAACWVTTGCGGWPRCGAAPPLCSGCARLRRCFRAVLALRSAGWCVAAALGTVVCRSFPSLGFVGAPTILSHFSWWRSLFGSASDEAWAGFRGAFRLVLGDLSDVWVGALVQTNTVRDELERTTPLLTGAAHTRAAMRIITAHLCDSVRGRGRMCRASISTQIAAMLSAPIQAKPGPRFQRGRPTQQHSPAVGQLLMTSI